MNLHARLFLQNFAQARADKDKKAVNQLVMAVNFNGKIEQKNQLMPVTKSINRNVT
ncbi:hypothetical protein [Erwinia billingiae]|uniref:hypothetical protein n=1 Tax=Erwinia billingiae TaxID=182337 RepID=UPI00177D385A|nr:hypothetical protein [Erwinia billingiae]